MLATVGYQSVSTISILFGSPCKEGIKERMALSMLNAMLCEVGGDDSSC